jgi:hypothetical protein
MMRKNRVGSQAVYQITRLRESRIDFVTKSGGPCIGETLEGIYKIEGDTLWLCYSTLPRDDGDMPILRPTKYAAPNGSSYMLLVLKKQTPKKE